MNKVTRLLSSAALAASLTLGGSALTAGAAFGDSGNNQASYNNDHRGDDGRRGDDHRRGDDRDSRHNNSRYLYHCYDRHHDWYEWGNKYDHKWNCDLVYVRR